MAKSLFTSRYGRDDIQGEERLNAVIKTILSHRSVRSFLPDALPEETLKFLMAAAQSAPTSSNLQAWSVVIVRDAERKQALSLYAGDQAHMREAPVLLVWLADLSRFDRLATRVGKQADAVHYLESFLMAAVDAALAAQNVVVAAESMGLGTVYIGGIRNQPDRVAETLKLPPLVFPVFGLVLGKPDAERPASVKPRLPQSAVVFHEHYGFPEGQEESDIAAYDIALKQFQVNEGMPEIGWVRSALSRMRGPQSLFGRDRLKEIAHALGFKLL